jgi:hypothetical protein
MALPVHVDSLKATVFGNVEAHLLAGCKRSETRTRDRRLVDEDLTPLVTRDEAETFGVIEPLYFSCDTHGSLLT